MAEPLVSLHTLPGASTRKKAPEELDWVLFRYPSNDVPLATIMLSIAPGAGHLEAILVLAVLLAPTTQALVDLFVLLGLFLEILLHSLAQESDINVAHALAS